MENIKDISIVIKAVFDSASPINPNKDLWFQVSLLGLLSYYVYVWHYEDHICCLIIFGFYGIWSCEQPDSSKNGILFVN